MSLSLAYLDEGSGSLIVQALVAGTAGVSLKLSWRRLTGAFPRRATASCGPATGGSARASRIR